jgi:hypothetical protein
MRDMTAEEWIWFRENDRAEYERLMDLMEEEE